MSFIADRLRSVLGHGDRGGRSLALVDLAKHTRGGHFGPYLARFARALAPRFDRVHVVTPKPRLTRALLQAAGSVPVNVSFHRVPRTLRTTFDPGALPAACGAAPDGLSAMFLWGYDLLGLEPARAASTVPWAMLAGASWRLRGRDGEAAGKEARLLELARSFPSFRAFLQWDPYVNDRVPRGILIPDLEDHSVPPEPTPLSRMIRAHAAGRPCVGAFGMLMGYRCLHELLPLALAQPEVPFVIAGTIVERTVDPAVLHRIRHDPPPNLLVVPGFIPTDAALNDAIRSADALLVDGERYPVHSGIACRALALGRCIVTPRSDSWVSDLVRDRGVGIAYARRGEPLAPALEGWMAANGEARCRAVSAELRDPGVSAAFFDEVAGRLALPGPCLTR